MREKDFRIIEQFKQRISQRASVVEMRVFGSRARGNAVEESDLDVLVIVDHLDRSIEKYISECAWEVGFREDVVIMPIVLSIDAIKTSPLRESVFIKNVNREGVVV